METARLQRLSRRKSERCDVKRLAEFFPIVQWLTHTHEDEIGEGQRLGDGEYLVDDLVRSELPVEALLAGHAEITMHLASDLTGNAERGALVFGQINRFDVLANRCSKEISDGTVLRAGGIDRIFISYGITIGFETGAILLRKISHFVDGMHSFHVKPLCNLLGCEFWHAESSSDVLQFG